MYRQTWAFLTLYSDSVSVLLKRLGRSLAPSRESDEALFSIPARRASRFSFLRWIFLLPPAVSALQPHLYI